jgi:pSer/pThr/pTyr-binding forkhead associated (FHA) protein
MRSWVIGSRADCDVVVNSPVVSGRHCQVTQTPDGFVLDDLGATNGTYIDGVRITAPTRVIPGESITLGQVLPMPWPAELVRFITIGRLPDNEIMLDDPRVSSHHARLIVIEGRETRIQDLSSSNGTFLNSADRRVTIPTPITPTDTLFFGTFAVPAAQLLVAIEEPASATPQSPPAATVRESLQARTTPGTAAATSELTTALGGNGLRLALLAQAPVLAILIVLLFGRQAAASATATNWVSIGQAIASTTCALGLAAVLLGCSLAVGDVAAIRRRPTGPSRSVDPTTFVVSFGSRVGVLVACCAVGCTLLLAIVYWGSGFKGPWSSMWVVLVLASLVGLFIGLVVSTLIPNWPTAAAVMAGLFVLMVALGGRLWPLQAMGAPVRLIAGMTPSRWAFEGLFLLESPEHPAPSAPDAASPAPHPDPVESYFPANSERMGPRADAMALGSMLIGFAALTMFFSLKRRPAP